MNTKHILTENAERYLQEEIALLTQQWELDGADVGKADIEARLHEKYLRKGERLTMAEVSELVQTVTGEEKTSSEVASKKHSAFKAAKLKKGGRLKGFWSFGVSHWVAIVLWPTLVIIVEASVGVFPEMMAFAVIPSVKHLIYLLTLCAIAGGYYWARKTEHHSLRYFRLCRLAAIPGALYWSILLLPTLIAGFAISCVATIYTFGIGLPIFALCLATAAAPLYLLVGLLRNSEGKFGLREIMSKRGVTAVIVGVIGLSLIEAPSYLTRYGADKNDPQFIRNFGSEKVLLRMCYEGGGGRGSMTDTSGLVSSFWGRNRSRDFEQQKSREFYQEMYYKVTGKAFNSEPAPGGLSLNKVTNRRGSRGVVFDENLGGDGVFARVADLDMSASRMDGHLDQASGLAYWEWTMEFTNTGRVAKEARMQVLLPPQGVVSRLTLWVNGVPQEAAFSSKEKVTKAYKSVAVVQRRDPVLVRWVAPDRVLVQCFPVPANGTMKIRLGMTCELVDGGTLYLPRIIEQNFGLGSRGQKLETNLWVQGDTDLSMDGLKPSTQSGKWYKIHGNLSPKLAAQKHLCVIAKGSQKAEMVWTKDPFYEGEEVLLRTVSDEERELPKQLVMVVDGSYGVAEWKPAIISLVDELESKGCTVDVMTASGDEPIVGIRKMKKVKFAGGQDNIPALLSGYEKAIEANADAVVWFHGDLPVQIGDPESLSQLIERGFYQPKFMTVDLNGGTNRVLESLSNVVQLEQQIRPASPHLLSEAVLKQLSGTTDSERWERVLREDLPDGAVKVWDQLARWHAWDEYNSGEFDPTQTKKMARYQLVTPVSGAVVLETKQQYKDFDLKQVDPNSVPQVPSVPEPSSVLLLIVSLISVCFVRRRHV